MGRRFYLMGQVVSDILQRSHRKMQGRWMYKYLIVLVGIPIHLITYLFYVVKRKDHTYFSTLAEVRSEMIAAGHLEELLGLYKEQLLRKQTFFKEKVDKERTNQQAAQLAEEQFEKKAIEKTDEIIGQKGIGKPSYAIYFESLFARPSFLIISFVPGIFMYALLFLLSNPFVKYIVERLVQSIFVILGVAVLVFTILYISPFDPASNIIGVSATKGQIATFNHLYGLDLPYLQQLWNAVKGIATFDLGASFAGNEDVASSIAK